MTWTKNPGDVNNREVVLSANSEESNTVDGYSLAENNWDNTNMNVSLRILHADEQHEGLYMCEVETNSGHVHTAELIRVMVTGKMLSKYCFSSCYLAKYTLEK